MKLTALTSKRALAVNAASNTLGLLAQLAVSFVMAPVVLRALGDARYGVWTFVESFLAYLMLFDLGVGAALVRFVPRCRAAADRDGLNRVYSASLAFFVAVAGLAGLTGAAVLLLCGDDWLGVPAGLEPEAHVVYVVAALNFAATLPLSVYPAMLDGLN